MKKKGALALSYQEGDRAPRVLAKGERLMAEKILTLAELAGVPIVKDAALWELLRGEELGAYVPETSWLAIAAILAFVRRAGDGKGLL